MVGGTVNSKKMKGGVFKKLAQRKGGDLGGDEFTVREVEMDGKQTIRSLSGLRRDSEIMFLDKDASDSCLTSVSRGTDKFSDDIYNSEESTVFKEPSSIFNRPGFGSVAFRNSISALNAMTIHNQVDDSGGGEDSIGSAGSLTHSDRVNQEQQDWDDEDFSDEDDDEGEYTFLSMFLAANGLQQWIPKFVSEKIDLSALMLLTQEDLETTLKMPLGPRVKLLKAVKDRREAMENPDIIEDSHL